MLGRESGVARPAVFFAVRAVGREIIKIREIRVSRHRLQLVCRLVGAAKRAYLAKSRILHDKSQQLLGRLLLGYTEHHAVSEAVISEHRLKNFLALAFENIHVALGISLGIKADVARIGFTVGRDIFAELQIDLPPAFAAYPEPYGTRRVHAEVI